MEQDNRESWLNRVVAGMAPLFEALDAPFPPACGWRSASPAGEPRARRSASAGTTGAAATATSRYSSGLTSPTPPTRCRRRSPRSSRTSWSTRRSGSRPDTEERLNGSQSGWGWSGQCAPPPPGRLPFRHCTDPRCGRSPSPCQTRYRQRDYSAQEAGGADAEMRVLDVRLYRQDRAQMAGDSGRAFVPRSGARPDAPRSGRRRN